jgi:pyruvate-formate lyase
MNSLEEFHYAPEDVRNWGATGCVEPTLCGKHLGHTNCMMFSMVAALEMALNNGWHPLMRWDLGPKTGSIEAGDFKSFNDFLRAFDTQIKFLADLAVEYNNLLGLAHQYLRPTPFLSSLVEGPIMKGRDVTSSGAKYNSSGVACIGLADVTDSLMAIKKMVFEEQKITLADLKKAVDANFTGYPAIYAMVRKKVTLFGGGNPEAIEMANHIIDLTHDHFGGKRNYRGGPYTVGFWSMSNHVAFGSLAGALPSGRLAGKPFTPGLTPQAFASPNLLDNIRDVAQLRMQHITNNMAFNVRVTPGPKDSQADAVNHLYSYVKTYFELGGMQMQFNVVTSAILKDAMVHPENYRNLLVRISGYNAYFVTLNRDMQLELIERAEYHL